MRIREYVGFGAFYIQYRIRNDLIYRECAADIRIYYMHRRFVEKLINKLSEQL